MNYYYTHFDRLFDELTNFGDFTPELVENKSSVRLPNYPPCDCVVSRDRNTLGLRFAMAGYSEKDVSVTASEGSISVAAEPSKSDDERVVVHNGISKREIDFTLGVDTSYEARKAEVAFDNGLLLIDIPAKKEAESVKLL